VLSVLNILKKSHAFLEGHFLLSSGLHSKNYFQMALSYENPKYGAILSKELAKKFIDEKVDVIIGPALGGIIISYEVARFLKVRALFTERQDGVMTLRRGFKINKGENVLLVEDVITTAKSIKEVMPIIQKAQAKIAGIGCIVDRSEKEIKLPKKIKSLFRVKIKNYSPDICPLCKDGILLVKHGSGSVKAIAD